MIDARTARNLSDFHKDAVYYGQDGKNEFSSIMASISSRVDAMARLGKDFLTFTLNATEYRDDVLLVLLQQGFIVKAKPDEPDTLNISW